MITCTRCIYDETIPGITFYWADGVCNTCRLHDQMALEYPTGGKGLEILGRLRDKIKKDGQGKPYDCIVGISGGRDSSYLLHMAADMGLRVRAVHYDNGWDTEIAVSNMKKMTEALGTPLYNYKVRQVEVDDIIRAFLFSHTQDVEAATDLATVKVCLNQAKRFGIKYILDGHSFRTEGMAPLGWSYMDAKYVKAVHNAHGTIKLDTYPFLTLTDQLRSNVKRPRPLYCLDYNAEDIKEFLSREYGWEWYGGHHQENTFTAFFNYYRYHKLGYDGRIVELSALVRSRQITREEALEEIKKPVLIDNEILEEVKSRLYISDAKFKVIMDPTKKKTYKDWPHYNFRRLKPLLWGMMKAGKVPRTFYEKYVR